MFSPVRKDVFRWELPWQEADLMMVGHMFLKNSSCILVDPPYVSGLLQSLKRLADSFAIILTSQNHTRGTKYIASETGATIYMPEQNPDAIEPKELLSVKEIGSFEKYSGGSILGLKVLEDFADYALLTEEKELIVADNARGTSSGKLALWPECNPHDPPYPPNETIHKKFKKLIEETGAVSLLAGHGYDIIGNLQELAKDL